MSDVISTWPQLVANLSPLAVAVALGWELYRTRKRERCENADGEDAVWVIGLLRRPESRDGSFWIVNSWPIHPGSGAGSYNIPIELTGSNRFRIACQSKLGTKSKAA